MNRRYLRMLLMIVPVFFALQSSKLNTGKPVNTNGSLQVVPSNCLTLFGIPLYGDNEKEIIDKFVAGMPEMKLVGSKANDVPKVNLCGIPFGLNIIWVQDNSKVAATSVKLLTSLQDKNSFEKLKATISTHCGNPDIEEYEGGTDEIDGRFYGKCVWNEDCTITLRNAHSDEGGLVLYFEETTPKETKTAENSNKGLNEIRFEEWSDNDWIDNDYIRALRAYIDDYNRGVISNSTLDQYKDVVKGKFAIGNTEPFLLGGLFIRFMFIDHPNLMFATWVYSDVDEVNEVVTDYHVRSIQLDSDEAPFTKEEIIRINKEHPELKFW